MQDEIVFSKGKKPKHAYLKLPSSQILKSDAGLRNKMTPHGKQETGIFIHNMSDAEQLLARTSFQLLQNLREENTTFCKEILPSSFF